MIKAACILELSGGLGNVYLPTDLGIWQVDDNMLGLNILQQSWVHVGADTMRNHIDCQVVMNEYKKPEHKKPGLRTGDIFCNFGVFFLRMPELKDKPDG